jgi:hypothetical protein
MADTGRRIWSSRLGRQFGTLLLSCVAIACAGNEKPAPVTIAKAPPSPMKLAWMPLDAFDAPVVARAVNDELGRVKLAGASPAVKAAVSMEVAQLAIECIEPTTACYRAVGRSLGADRLIWAQIDPDEEKIRVTVVLFDVGAGTETRKVGMFDGEQAARAGVSALVAHAAEPRSAKP